MKKILAGSLCLMLLICSLLSSASFIEKNKIFEEFNEQTGFQALNIDETTIIITVNPGEFVFDSITTREGLFTTVTLPGYVYSLVKGEAKLPIIRKMIEIPQEAKPELTVKSVSWEFTSLEELGLPERIIPAQQSIEKIPEQSKDFVIDEEYYNIEIFMPKETVKIAEIGEIRSRRFALLEISPIQYKPATGELKLMTSCEIKVDLPNSDMIQTYQKIQRYSSPSYEKIFEIAFKNYGFYEYGNLNRQQEGILIIVYDNFYEEIQPLADMKTSKGLDTTVKKTSNIPGGATKENIRLYIEDAYDNWDIPPTYILLVGDTPQIPTYSGTTGPSAADLYYVTLDGSDFIPEIHIGRFPGSQESHIEVMVDKTVYYEAGVFPDNDWIWKAAFLASTDNYHISEGTHNYVIDNYLAPNDYICDKLYTYTYGATTQQVHDAINDGRSLVIFSGHGSPSGWGDGPAFYQSDVKNLMNEGIYPFVCSHSCSTNTFDDSECFGETWLREEDKAGLAFWGASASTYWDEDDILEKGMFQAWWEDGLESIGGMTDMGLMYLYENYSGSGLTKYYFEAYNVNGDPSVKIWSDNPTLPPEKPTTPEGPEEWIKDIDTTFSTSTTDPEGSSVYFLFDWGDGKDSGWVGPFASGQTGEALHNWTNLGSYEVMVIAKDNYGAFSEWSDKTIITIVENEPPETPTIKGPNNGRPKLLINFEISTEDPEGHDVYYMVHWGDGSFTPYEGPYASGEKVTFSHAWSEKNDYSINVKAKDIYEGISPLGSFKISINRDRASTNTILFPIIQKFANYFSIIKMFSLLISNFEQ